jgi:hypothetical protein
MNKKELCKTWTCNLAQAFLALMGEAILRYSNNYSELEDAYEFEKRDLLVAYYLAAQQNKQISKYEQAAFERDFQQNYQNSPQAVLSFEQEGFLEFDMPLATYRGDWKLEALDNEQGKTEYFIQAFLGMRTLKKEYTEIPTGWELEESGDNLKLKKQLLDALSLSVPLRLLPDLPLHIRAKVVKNNPETLVLDYQSPRGAMSVTLKAK